MIFRREFAIGSCLALLLACASTGFSQPDPGQEAGAALAQYKEAARRARADHDVVGEGKSDLLCGEEERVLNEWDEARHSFGEAAVLFAQVGDKSSQAEALCQEGECAFELDDVPESLRLCGEAKAAANGTAQIEEAKALNSIGLIYHRLGRYDDAITCFERAVALYAGKEEFLATVLTNEATSLVELGKVREAQVLFNKALGFATSLEIQANVCRGIGSACNFRRLWADALPYLQKALDVYRELGNRQAEAVTLNAMGISYRYSHDYSSAVSHLEQALAIEVGQQRISDQAATLGNIAFVLDSEGMPESAVLFAKHSVNLYEQLRRKLRTLPHDLRESYDNNIKPVYRLLIKLLAKQNRIGEAEEVIDLVQGVEDFEFGNARTRGGSLEAQIEEVGKEKGWWDGWSKDQNQALAIEATLSEDLSKRSALYRTKAPQAEIDKLDQAIEGLQGEDRKIRDATHAYLVELENQAMSSTSPSKTDQTTTGWADQYSADQIARLQQEENEVPNLLKKARSNVGAVFVISSGDDLIYFVSTNASPTIVQTAQVPSAELSAMIANFRSLLRNAKKDPRPLGEHIYGLLFKSVLDRLSAANCTRVLWCMDNALHYIPLEALWDGSEYLVEKFHFSRFDPARLPGLAQSMSKDPSAIAFGTEKGDGDRFSDLPSVAAEIRQVVKSSAKPGFSGAIPGDAYEGSEFNKGRFEAALEDPGYTILHLATHFALGDTMDSSVILLGDKTPYSLHEFDDATVGSRLAHFDLVCLSACDTAKAVKGKPDSFLKGGELTSFVRLAMANGAGAVIASLWQVNDPSTALLMRTFYQSWKDQPTLGKEEALRQAELSLLHSVRGLPTIAIRPRSESNAATDDDDADAPSYPADAGLSHPYFWAPFLLFGNWN